MKTSKLISLVSILLFFTFGTLQASHASITFDEGPHLTAGYTILKTGDYRLQPVHIHPPLANLLAALPALLLPDLPDPATIEGWDISSLSALTDTIVWQYPAPARLIYPARIPIVLAGILLLAIIHRWTRTIAGNRAATMAMLFAALDPNLIAHGALVTTDMAAVLTIVLTLFVLSHYAKSKAGTKASIWLALLVGLCVGVTQLTKTSGTIVLPFVAAIGLLRFTRVIRARDRRLWRNVVGEGVIILVSTFLILWAGYGFQLGQYHGITLPAAPHFNMLDAFRQHYAIGHSEFALGRVARSGWWWYFPLAFVIKTPLPILLLLLIGLVAGAVRTIRTHGVGINVDIVLLLVFVALYASSSLFSSVNIGYRHLLPILPALYILTSISLDRLLKGTLTNLRWRNKVITVIMVISGMVPLLRCTPYPLAFFNLLIGDKANADHYLVDSNLDWGQNWWDLKAWQIENPSDNLKVAHYSPARLELYGIPATYLPPSPKALEFSPWAPAPGVYAIGATVLQGAYVADINTYAWFRDQEPIVRLGNAVMLYDAGDVQNIPDVLVICTPHDVDYFTERYGVTPARILRPDCLRASVFVPQPLITHYLAGSDLTFSGPVTTILSLRDAEGKVPYRLFMAGVPEPEIKRPIEFGGPLRLLGYDLDSGRDRVQINTFWQVTGIPARPLSLMAHLVDTNGAVITVDDALGYPIDQWQTGDVFVQKHTFAVNGTEPAMINLGGYWLDTMERWLTQNSAPMDHAAIELPE